MNSFWINNFKTKSYDSLDKDLDVDVCIIGGGITGISCGYYLAKNNLKVCILEKDKIMEKTSGHTTAKITSQHGLIYKYLYDSYGKDLGNKIVFSIEGEHLLQIGYSYAENTEGGLLINYEEKIFPKEAEEWYLYKVPLLLNGKGKMKKISKTRFVFTSVIRKLANHWFFLLIVILSIVVISFLK